MNCLCSFMRASLKSVVASELLVLPVRAALVCFVPYFRQSTWKHLLALYLIALATFIVAVTASRSSSSGGGASSSCSMGSDVLWGDAVVASDDGKTHFQVSSYFPSVGTHR